MSFFVSVSTFDSVLAFTFDSDSLRESICVIDRLGDWRIYTNLDSDYSRLAAEEKAWGGFPRPANSTDRAMVIEGYTNYSYSDLEVLDDDQDDDQDDDHHHQDFLVDDKDDHLYHLQENLEGIRVRY